MQIKDKDALNYDNLKKLKPNQQKNYSRRPVDTAKRDNKEKGRMNILNQDFTSI